MLNSKLMRLLRASFFAALLAGAAASSVALVPSDARSSVSIAVAFDALVKDADAVAIITPQDASSVWEDGRIVTYTRVKIDQSVAGDAPRETWVRTLGGVVGKVGQLVDGEPVLTPGKPSLLFLHKFRTAGTWEVSARAQGQFPIVVDEATKMRRVIRNANAGMLLPPRVTPPDGKPGGAQPQATPPSGLSPAIKARLAAEVLHDRDVSDATREIASAWKIAHPAPAK